MVDRSEEFIAQIRQAAANERPLRIQGGGSKNFYGRPVEGELLDTRGHSGIVNYEPTELVLTARAGTLLRDIEAVLAAEGQLLAFEPPHFDGDATLGGVVASGLAGPRRLAGGSVRDSLLGVRVVNGRGELLRFGGEVMKNVAGFDVSRLMAGAQGTLGLLTEVSLRVHPAPEVERTQVLECERAAIPRLLDRWQSDALPVSATAHDGTRLYVRISGPARTVAAAADAIGGEQLPDDASFWRDLRDHRLPFFQGAAPLWKLSLPPHGAEPELPDGEFFYEWGDRIRWLKTTASPDDIRRAATACGGHAMLFRGGPDTAERFHPLASGVAKLHHNLKRAFDPHGILNPGRLYRDL